MGPLVPVEDVHHHVAEVEQHPAAPPLPFAADHAVPVRGQLLLDALGDGLELPIAAAAADDEKVRVSGHPPQVEHHHVLRLLFQGGAGGSHGGSLRLFVYACGRSGRGAFGT